MNTKILAGILILVLVTIIPSQVFAGTYSDKTFSIFTGKYNDNGEVKFKGFMKHTKNYIKITGIGQLKEWTMEDSSIPNCRHAFSTDFTILFNNNQDHAKLYITGKLCNASSSSQWKTFRGNYIIYEGDVKYTENVNGQGIIEFTINTKTNEILAGKMAGTLVLYT